MKATYTISMLCIFYSKYTSTMLMEHGEKTVSTEKLKHGIKNMMAHYFSKKIDTKYKTKHIAHACSAISLNRTL